MVNQDGSAPTQLRDIAVGTADIFMLRPADVAVDPDFNIRDFSLPENIAHIRSLADNIKAVGAVLTPIVVRWADGKAILVSGECRLRATLLAIEEGVTIDAIPAIPERERSEALRALSFFSDNTGKNHNQLEQSVAVARAANLGLSASQIAKEIGVTTTWVSELLTLAEAPDGVKAMVREGRVSPTGAAEAVRKEGSNAEALLSKAAEIAKAAGKEKITPKHVRAARAAAKAEPTAVTDSQPLPENVTRLYPRGDVDVLKRALTTILFSTSDSRAKEIARKALAVFGGEAEEPQVHAEAS